MTQCNVAFTDIS